MGIITRGTQEGGNGAFLATTGGESFLSRRFMNLSGLSMEIKPENHRPAFEARGKHVLPVEQPSASASQPVIFCNYSTNSNYNVQKMG